MNLLGRFYLSSTEWSFLTALPVISRLFPIKTSHEATGYSSSQARYLALVAASVLHTFHFIMMGSKGGFPAMFLAYAVAAFARAYLTGNVFVYLPN